ncbi:hypothetical protein ACWCP6_02685 [Streptomyces sp. NPDC002004]
MAASAHLLLSALSKRPPVSPLSVVPEPAPASDDCLCLGAEGTCAELPLTSEPPLADVVPLTSEPPLADEAPLTSEAASMMVAAGADPSVA